MTDRSTVRTIVYLLGAIALVGLVGVIWLIRVGVDVQAVAVVVAFAAPAVGSLGTLLAQTRTTPSDAEIREALAGLNPPAAARVVVTNEGAAEAIPTTPVPDEPPRRRSAPS